MEIKKAKKENIINKIRKLSRRDIDKLFYNCGWIDEEKGENKSLPNDKINKIKRGDNRLIDVFIQETGIKEIEKKLKK